MGLIAYRTVFGMMINSKCEDYIAELISRPSFEKFNLILTSPPFPLNRAKKYGNMAGSEYLEWMRTLSVLFNQVLDDKGSIVIEIGNAWITGSPEQSTLPIEALFSFKEAGNFHLCEEFIVYNPARLPSPIEWVNKKRIRVKDSFTRIWWLAKTTEPKANNRNVLQPYSKQMEKLLKNKAYNSGRRPSEYLIGRESFNTDNGGSIPSNVLIASNTVSNDSYLKYCKEHGYEIHPARMPKEIPDFFVRFLTDENDLVFDPFAGSNTTGYICEELNRRWISTEAELKYIQGSFGRFESAILAN